MSGIGRIVRLALALVITLVAVPALAQRLTGDDRPALARAAVEGVISSVAPPSSPAGGPVVGLLDGLISVDTTGAEILKPGGKPGSAADLVVGVRIAVILEETTTAPPLVAKTVYVFAEPPQVLLAGKVDAVDVTAGTFTLLGLTVHVTDRTAWGGPRGATGPAGLPDLKPGYPVTASVANVAGEITALRVLVLAPAPEPMEQFRGTVKAIGTTAWTITVRDGTDREVTVNAETRIVGAPAVGDMVEVVGHSDSAGGFLAQLIAKIPAEPPQPERLRGVVRSIGRDSWTIGTGSPTSPDVVVKVDAETRIVGDPHVGDTVEILALREAAGDLLAKLIVKVGSGGTEDVVFTGAVKAIAGNIWTIGDVNVLVTPMTRIFGNPVVGDTVRCTARRMPGTGLALAVSIEKISTAGGR